MSMNYLVWLYGVVVLFVQLPRGAFCAPKMVSIQAFDGCRRQDAGRAVLDITAVDPGATVSGLHESHLEVVGIGGRFITSKMCCDFTEGSVLCDGDPALSAAYHDILASVSAANPLAINRMASAPMSSDPPKYDVMIATHEECRRKEAGRATLDITHVDPSSSVTGTHSSHFELRGNGARFVTATTCCEFSPDSVMCDADPALTTAYQDILDSVSDSTPLAVNRLVVGRGSGTLLQFND